MSLPVISRETQMERSAITLVDGNLSKRDEKSLYRYAIAFIQKGVPFIIQFLKQSFVFWLQVKLWLQIQRKVRLEMDYLTPALADHAPIYSSEKTNSNLYIG